MVDYDRIKDMFKEQLEPINKEIKGMRARLSQLEESDDSDVEAGVNEK